MHYTLNSEARIFKSLALSKKKIKFARGKSFQAHRSKNITYLFIKVHVDRVH